MSNHSLLNPVCSYTTSSTKAFVPHYSTSFSSSVSPLSSSASLSWTNYSSRKLIKLTHFSTKPKNKGFRVSSSQSEPLRVMISGAPASGKGTQCEMIVQKFGLVHVSTGDLLRAEVNAGTDIGKKAKEYMNSGRLVPDEIVTQMVQTRLSLPDAKERGWLLDGYPRSLSQAESLEKMKIRPDICIMLDVPDTTLIERCVGRRLDPVTGKIYHIKYFPPENEEIKSRLVTRPDDTEEKVKSRLQIYKENTNAIITTYGNILKKLNGNCPKEEVFSEIRSLLTDVQKQREDERKSGQIKEYESICLLAPSASPS